MPVRQHENHFSIDEARSLIPWLTEKLREIQSLLKRVDESGFDPVTGKWTPSGNGHSNSPPPKEYEKLVRAIAEVDQKGVVIKNFVKGIIDFPHIDSDGMEVYLCWILGEETVSHWHYLTDQFMDRVPISTDPPALPPA